MLPVWTEVTAPVPVAGPPGSDAPLVSGLTAPYGWVGSHGRAAPDPAGRRWASDAPPPPPRPPGATAGGAACGDTPPSPCLKGEAEETDGDKGHMRSRQKRQMNAKVRASSQNPTSLLIISQDEGMTSLNDVILFIVSQLTVNKLLQIRQKHSQFQPTKH